MFKKARRIIEPGLIPFSLAILFFLFTILYRFLELPSPKELVLITKSLYERYGVAAIVIAAFLEGFFMLSLYFPGSFILVVAVLTSNMDLVSLITIGSLSWLGFMLAGVVNYIMGRYGYYKALLFLGKQGTIENMKKWMHKYGRWAMFLSAFHPNYLSVSLVCSGISRLRFLNTLFIAGSSLIFWIFLWLLLVTPFLNRLNIEDPNQSAYIILVFIGWGIVLIFIDNIQKFRKSKIKQ